jgi:hypothetical protein
MRADGEGSGMIKKILSFFTKSELEKLEIESEDIDEHLAKLIIAAEKMIKDLQKALKNDDLSEKDEDTKELKAEFEKILHNVDVLRKEVERIRHIKAQKNMMQGPDNDFLNDKISQLRLMQDALSSLISIMEEAPSDQEYEDSLFDQIIRYLNELITAVNKIKADDDALLKIYRKTVGKG